MNGEFKFLIPEADESKASKAKRVVFCSGKIYFELNAIRNDKSLDHIAIVRLEQLYPFPHDAFKEQIEL